MTHAPYSAKSASEPGFTFCALTLTCTAWLIPVLSGFKLFICVLGFCAWATHATTSAVFCSQGFGSALTGGGPESSGGAAFRPALGGSGGAEFLPVLGVLEASDDLTPCTSDKRRVC